MRDPPGSALPLVCFPHFLSPNYRTVRETAAALYHEGAGPGPVLASVSPSPSLGAPTAHGPHALRAHPPTRTRHTRRATLRPVPTSPHYGLGFRELFLFMTPTRPPPRKEQSGGSSVSLASMRLSLGPGSRGPSELLMGVLTALPTRDCRGRMRGWVRVEGRDPGHLAGGS